MQQFTNIEPQINEEDYSNDEEDSTDEEEDSTDIEDN